MAKIEKLVPIIFQWEGGWSDRKADRGGKTNMGVTLSTWKSQGYDKNGDGGIDEHDLKLIDKTDVVTLLKNGYWDKWKADMIRNQSIANLLVDWVWNSGIHGIKIPQRLMGLKTDGVVGPITLNSVNNANQRNLFFMIKEARLEFIDDIVKNDPTQKANLNGWKNRINSFIFSE